MIKNIKMLFRLGYLFKVGSGSVIDKDFFCLFEGCCCLVEMLVSWD